MRKIIITALAALLAAYGSATAASDTGRYYRDSFGGVGYLVYEPPTYVADDGKPLGLVMGLHGCGGGAEFFLKQTRLDAKAAAESLAGRGFIVVLPEQKANLKCWRFNSAKHETRDPGFPGVLASVGNTRGDLNEPTLLAGIARRVVESYSAGIHARKVDPARVYAMGFSAGAAMSVILGVTYPDVFTAIGVHSGCEYKCGLFQIDPQRSGDAAFDAMPAESRRVVPMLAIVGSYDRMAPPKNTSNAVTAWAQTNDRTSDGMDDDNITAVLPLPPHNSEAAGTVASNGRSYERSTYRDVRNNAVVVEKYVVKGMGHQWSGGPAGLSYSDPRGPDATGLMIDFFNGHVR